MARRRDPKFRDTGNSGDTKFRGIPNNSGDTKSGDTIPNWRPARDSFPTRTKSVMLSLCQPRSARRRARSVRPWQRRSLSRAGPNGGRTPPLCAGSADPVFVHRASRAQADISTGHSALARVSSATLATLAARAPASRFDFFPRHAPYASCYSRKSTVPWCFAAPEILLSLRRRHRAPAFGACPAIWPGSSKE